mgnify:CR=1 FL=1
MRRARVLALAGVLILAPPALAQEQECSLDTWAEDLVAAARGVQGLRELAEGMGVPAGSPAPALASAIDFVLEGLCAQRKISRSEERGYSAGTEGTAKARGRREEPVMEEDIRIPGGKKKYYN